MRLLLGAPWHLVSWERGYIERLLDAHDHNLSRAARSARMGRSNLRELARRFGLRGDDDASEA